MEDYDFALPESSIAQHPADRRRDARLLCWREDGALEHRHFAEIVELLRPDDLLVLNDTRVFPARLFGHKRSGTARVEVLLIRPVAEEGRVWEAMVRPGRRLSEGTVVALDGGLDLTVGKGVDDGARLVHFADGERVHAHCEAHGHVPLPPYIRRGDEGEDRERYQTVFAEETGSVAAPTAGLHFDDALLETLRDRSVEIAKVTLHVGPGTFRPIDDATLATGRLHAEWRSVGASTLDALQRCRSRAGRVIAVGTTVCRTLESLPDAPCSQGVDGDTRLLIAPGHRFRWTDVLVTNFHLPRSSLLLLVAALAGDMWRDAYETAVRDGYRFYSYGDANWIEARR